MNKIGKDRLRFWAKRIAMNLAIICVAQYLIICAFVLFKINDAMFHPQEPSYSWDTPHVVNMNAAPAGVLVDPPPIPIAAFWHPNAQTNKVILYLHGNAEDIGDLAGVFEDFHKSGFSVFAPDYPGYGLSRGKPTEKNVYDTAVMAYLFLIAHGVEASDIIVLGRSIGSGPACYLAENVPVGGLVVESGFTSAPRVVTRIRILPFDPFPNIRRVRNIACPKLFIHGVNDSTVPVSHGKALFAAAKEPKTLLLIDTAGHDDLMFEFGGYFETLRDFVSRRDAEAQRDIENENFRF